MPSTRLSNNGLFVLFRLPRPGDVNPLWRDLTIQIGILCLVSVAGMLAALLGARLLVTRWTEKLADAANAMGLGNLSVGRTDLAGAPIDCAIWGRTLRRWPCASSIARRIFVILLPRSS